VIARRRSILERLLRGLVRLLPADFRSEFADAIDADLDERSAAGDRVGLLRRELPSLAAAILREHGQPWKAQSGPGVRP
jgi:hypothetical protein